MGSTQKDRIVFETMEEAAIDPESGARLRVRILPGGSWWWDVVVPCLTDKNLSWARGGGNGEAPTQKAARAAARSALARSLKKYPQRAPEPRR